MSERKFKISLEHTWQTFSFGVGIVNAYERYLYIDFMFWNLAIGEQL